jgi:hypothetical protein
MAIYTANVGTGNDDYEIDIFASPDTTGYTATLVSCRSNRDSFNVLTARDEAHADVDTSGLDPSWIINGATLNWYTDLYATQPKAHAEGSSIDMWDSGSSIWRAVETSTANRIVGWESHALTAGELAYIDINGVTKFRFQMLDLILANQVRTWSIRSYEHTIGSTFSVYLDVDYTIPSVGGPRKRIFIIG